MACLLNPDAEMAATVRTVVAGLAADGPTVAFELHRSVEGDLAGMFDGHITLGNDLDGAMVVLDLFAFYDSSALRPRVGAAKVESS